MTPSLPSWVQKRDGRREAFDADKISQGLYAATEAIGVPNAFLARELTDGVLHFLEQEKDSETVTTAQIAELVEKVVRELGQPALAQAFAAAVRSTQRGEVSPKPRPEASYAFSIEDSPVKVTSECLTAYSLHAVFSRDIAAAHSAGLLYLDGLVSPRLLEAVVVDPPPVGTADSPWMLGWSQVREASQQAARLVVDNPELILAAHGPPWLEGFAAALEAYGSGATMNLRPATPPNWAKDLSTGPLFANVASSERGTGDHANSILKAAESCEEIDIRWHLQDQDFEDAARRDALRAMLARAETLSAETLNRIVFVFDRPRQPVNLWNGIDRSHPADLMFVWLMLNAFLKLPEVGGDAARMLEKLPSLVRMVASAGVQKRNYLRRHCPELARGFLLDRARLVVEPFGVAEVVRALTGVSPVQSPLAQRTFCQILETVCAAALRESKITGLEIVVREHQGTNLCKDVLAETDVRAAQENSRALSKVVESGCLAVMAKDFTEETAWHHLSQAWRNGRVAQVALVRVPLDLPD